MRACHHGAESITVGIYTDAIQLTVLVSPAIFTTIRHRRSTGELIFASPGFLFVPFELKSRCRFAHENPDFLVIIAAGNDGHKSSDQTVCDNVCLRALQASLFISDRCPCAVQELFGCRGDSVER